MHWHSYGLWELAPIAPLIVALLIMAAAAAPVMCYALFLVWYIALWIVYGRYLTRAVWCDASGIGVVYWLGRRQFRAWKQLTEVHVEHWGVWFAWCRLESDHPMLSFPITPSWGVRVKDRVMLIKTIIDRADLRFAESGGFRVRHGQWGYVVHRRPDAPCR